MPKIFWKNALALVAGIMLIIALLLNVGPRSVLVAFQTALPTYLALGLLAYAIFFVLRGIRWKALLAAPRPAQASRPPPPFRPSDGS